VCSEHLLGQGVEVSALIRVYQRPIILLAADEQQINADFGKPDRKRRTRAIPVAEAPKEFPA
jgi:hypothetical protein